MKTKEFSAHGVYRRDSYKLLSECFYPPDKELIETLGCLDKSRGRLYLEIASAIPGIIDAELLRIDYSRLFLGPYALLAPPYGSVYLESKRMVMGDSTINARHRYAEEGLTIGIKEAPDHIAIELEFMYYLISKEVEAALNSDYVNMTGYLRKQRDFLENHLGIWVSDFADKIATNAETSFYRNLAGQTKSFIKEDSKYLGNTSLSTIQHTLPA